MIDIFDVYHRLNLKDDVLAVIDKCEKKPGSAHCVDQLQEIIGSMDAQEDEFGCYQKVKVVAELDAIAAACPRAPDQFCRARLLVSNILQTPGNEWDEAYGGPENPSDSVLKS
ncbi:MAG: hypothetical protein ISR44_08860 [Rhodospirillales bacterium]|nr:hypothetical protein [Rhodospirillales bacterium]